MSTPTENISSSHDKHPRLRVLPYGGTILSQVDFDPTSGREIIKPTADVSAAFEQLKAGISHLTLSRFKSIDCFPNPDLIDSSQAMANVHIVSIVQDVRERIARDEADVFLLLYGTDTMADLVTALGFGLSREELENKAVIVTGSMQHLDVDHSDAHRNFKQSVELGLTEEIRGRAGLCMSNRFFPPRRLQKIQLNREHPFACGFRRGAKYMHDQARWNFDRHSEEFDFPLGKKDEEFRLAQGVERIALTATSDYGALESMVKKNVATVLTAPGNGNLRMDPTSIGLLKKAAAKAAGPVIVVGEAIQNPDAEDAAPDNQWQHAVYEGDASLQAGGKLFSGGLMSESEARIFVSMILADEGTKDLSRAKKAAEVGEKLAQYPFRSPENCAWRTL